MLDSRKLLKGSAILLGASVFARGSMLLFRYVAALNLSTEDYGRLSLYISLFLSMSTVASFGVGGALAKLAVQDGKPERDHGALYYNSILLTLCTTILATCAFAFVLGQSSRELLTFRNIAVTAVGFLFWSYFQISIGFSLAELKFSLASIYEAGDGIIKLLLVAVFGLLMAKINLEVFILSFSLGYVLLSGLAAQNNARVLGLGVCKNPLKSFDAPLFKGLVGHSSSLMLITFVNLFYGFILRSFLAGSSNTEVALFDMALTFYSVPRMVFVSLVRPVVPYASRNVGGRIVIPQIGKVLAVFAAVMAFMTFAYMSGLIAAILRELGLGVYLESFPVFIILMSGALFDLGFGFLSSYFQGAGKVHVVSTLTLGAFVLTLPFSYYAVKAFGIYGAATANVIFITLLAGMTTWFAQRQIGFQMVGSFQRGAV